jgi:hypothetical protein
MTSIIKYLIALLVTLIAGQLSAQSFSSKLLDKKTNEPIPFATIQYGEHRGVITNEEGIFNFTLRAKVIATDSLYISSMGYEKKSFALQSQLDSIIYLAPKVFELKTVFLSNNPLDAEEIIDKVKENLAVNYKVSLSKKKIFFRQSDLSQMNKVDFGFQKSTIAELDKHLIDSIAGLVPKHSSYYREALGDFYGDYSKHKFHIDKAAELYDKNKDISMDGLSDKMERIFKENVKPNSYLKIKSGLFSSKVQLDSLKKEHKEEGDAFVKVENTDSQNFNQEMQNRISELYEQLFFNDDSKIDVLRKSNRYEFTIDDYTYIDESPVYIIKFEPKGRKDFKGTMYVNIDDFAIMRFEFNNVRPIQRFGLLGITYRHNVYNGRMLFQKDAAGGYSPKYLELDSGTYFGLNRPLKVIEKNKHVRGRRKQNELSLKLDIIMTQRNKFELVVFDSENINESTYESAAENKDVKASYLSKYDATFWQGYTIMEPNAAIQAFKVIESEK